ncbi:hypothetical protein LWI29_021444 [Acer saccharum]|uniref:Uncharacterized protein n=1 Tax=Acer saccharum TaxID=4024 RepID=A0AA39RNC4_ACESA|nr:hypothetical protein LWI29_021444 [Acer saccharum]
MFDAAFGLCFLLFGGVCCSLFALGFSDFANNDFNYEGDDNVPDAVSVGSDVVSVGSVGSDSEEVVEVDDAREDGGVDRVRDEHGVDDEMNQVHGALAVAVVEEEDVSVNLELMEDLTDYHRRNVNRITRQRYCARHIYANFRKTYSTKKLKDLFWEANRAYDRHVFKRVMADIAGHNKRTCKGVQTSRSNKEAATDASSSQPAQGGGASSSQPLTVVQTQQQSQVTMHLD